MITFKSVGHFFAKAWTVLKNEEPKIENALAKIEGEKSTVETVSAAIAGPAAPAVIGVEDVAFALLGEASALLASGDAAAAKKLTDAGLDVNVVTNVQNLLKTAPQLVSVAKTL